MKKKPTKTSAKKPKLPQLGPGEVLLKTDGTSHLVAQESTLRKMATKTDEALAASGWLPYKSVLEKYK